LAVYLVVFQLLPIGRAAELICDLTGARCSQGWVMSVLEEAHDGLAGIDALIKTLITLSYVVHADETGMKVSAGTPGKAGSKGWLHVASTSLLTSYLAHPGRGLKAVAAHGVLPGLRGVGARSHPGWVRGGPTCLDRPGGHRRRPHHPHRPARRTPPDHQSHPRRKQALLTS
jgi:hypothetical protein